MQRVIEVEFDAKQKQTVTRGVDNLYWLREAMRKAYDAAPDKPERLTKDEAISLMVSKALRMFHPGDEVLEISIPGGKIFLANQRGIGILSRNPQLIS